MNHSFSKILKSVLVTASCMSLGFFLAFVIHDNSRYFKLPELPSKTTATAINASAGKNTLQYFYFNKNTSLKLNVSALSYLVGDLQTGEIILAKNQKKQFPIASVSKLMTATISKEAQSPDELIQISKQALATEGENGNFRLNEKIGESKILYPLLLESSNDAAEAIAIHGGRDIFMEEMNQKAKDLGLDSTTFEDPSGLSINNKSTTLDLFKLAKYIKDSHPDLFALTLNKSYKDGSHVWFSNNQFLNRENYLGGKSGYTDPARQTVVSLFSLPLGDASGDRPKREIAITLLHSTDRSKDVQNILKYLERNIYYGTEATANALWAKEHDGVAEIKDPDFVTMAFGGDIMLDRGVRNSVNKNFDGDYSKIFDQPELSKVLKKNDIVFANLEGTASDKGHDMGNLYAFQMDPGVVPALKGAGIDILSVANNHVGDFGRDSYNDTLARLKENEILYVGGGTNEYEASQPAIVEKNGMKIGFLAFSDKGPDWMAATGVESGVLLASNPRFDEIIKSASAQVDYLVVSLHFGEEYQKAHNVRQENLAHRAIDDGAKIIIGAHPHVVQDFETYKKGFIAYSLGNFIFDQVFSTDTMGGMLLELRLNKDGSMTTKKNMIELTRAFQVNKLIPGKEEKVKFNP